MSLEVIGLGLGRTGTLSLKQALEELGFGPCYHMDTLLKQPGDVDYWNEIEQTGKTSFDKLFANYGSAVDFPTVAYHPDLLRQYPDAKCILTVRDENEWYRSAQATILQAEPSLAEKIAISVKLPFSRRHRKLLKVFRLTEKFWQLKPDPAYRDEAIRFYREWNQRIIDSFPADQLLVFDVTEGWGPLCDFLHVDQPATAFPYGNRKADFKRKYRGLMGV
jgi:hypothetical protein